MQNEVTAQIYPWQQTVWDTLTGRFPQLGHGLLFYGKKAVAKKLLRSSFWPGFCASIVMSAICPVASAAVVNG